jgi:hypothetical protein
MVPPESARSHNGYSSFARFHIQGIFLNAESILMNFPAMIRQYD